jgi:hypothetical protein
MKFGRSDYDSRIVDRAGLIPENEPVFLLRGQDVAAWITVCVYADAAARHGRAPTFVESCIMQAERMRVWPIKRIPDMRAFAPVMPHLSGPTYPVFESQTPATAKDGEGLEPVMLIRGKSVGAAEAVRHYADLIEVAGADPALVATVRNTADAMAAWPEKTVPKAPTP